MEKLVGTVTNIQRKKASNGSKYQVITVDGTKFSVFDEKLFGEFEEGQEVTIQYTEKVKNNNTFRNIQKANRVDKSTTQTNSQALGDEPKLKAQALLAAAVFATTQDKAIQSKDLLKVSDLFLEYIKS